MTLLSSPVHVAISHDASIVVPAMAHVRKTQARMALLLITLACMVALCFVPVSNAEALTSGSIEYDLNADGDVVITGLVDGAVDVTIPSTIDSKSVVGIENHAFKNHSSLKSVYFEASGITEIPLYAFKGCKSLESVEFDEWSSIEKIETGAFYECTALKTFEAPDSLASIDYASFEGCFHLTTVDLEDSRLAEIGDRAFMHCKNLSSVTLPLTLRIINEGAFQYCPALEEIALPEGFEAICDWAFADTGLVSIDWPSGLKTVGNYAFARSALKYVMIPAGVDFGSSGYPNGFTFSECGELLGASFQEGVTEVPNGMFNKCTALKAAALPDSLLTIGNSAFCGCTDLFSQRLPRNLTSLGYDAFADTNMSYIYFTVKEVELGSYTDIEGHVHNPFGDTSVKNQKSLAVFGPDKLPSTPIVKAVKAVGGGYHYPDTKGDPISNTVIVKFDPGVADGKAITYLQPKDMRVAIPECMYSNEDGVFTTWSYTAGGDSTSIQPGGYLELKHWVTLTAQWDTDVWKATFAANGGDGDELVVMVPKSGDLEVTLPACPYTAPEGKTFIGWKMPSYIYGGATLQPGTTVYIGETNPIMLAQWAGTYAVAFDAMGGEASWAEDFTNVSGKLEALPNAKKLGHALSHWSPNDDLTGQVSLSTTYTKDTTLYAVWEPVSYDITFDANGGSFGGFYSMTVDTEKGTGKIPANAWPKPNTRTGYTLEGWYTDPDEGELIPSDYAFPGETTLYAHWAPIMVSEITLDKSTATLEVGKTLQLTATVSPIDALDTNVEWGSGDTKIATVSDAGEVKAIAPGVATIRVKSADGGAEATCDVTVKAKPSESSSSSSSSSASSSSAGDEGSSSSSSAAEESSGSSDPAGGSASSGTSGTSGGSTSSASSGSSASGGTAAGGSSGAASGTSGGSASSEAASGSSAASQGAGDSGTSSGSGASSGSGGSSSDSPQVKPVVPAKKATRLYGETALDTMHEVVARGFDSADAVVVATAEGYWDALAASSLAGALGAPVLMTYPDKLSEQTSAEIARLGAKKAYIAGGSAALSEGVVRELEGKGLEVERIFGADAQATAIAIANKVADQAGRTCVVATSAGYWDALAASPFGYACIAPIFLTDESGALRQDTLAAIKAGGFTSAVIAGGFAAVDKATEQTLTHNTGVKEIMRCGGADAYGTSVLLAKYGAQHGLSYRTVGIATSDNGYWDALTGSALCGVEKGVLVLADGRDTSSVAEIVEPNKQDVEVVYIFGGPVAVAPSVDGVVEEALK